MKNKLLINIIAVLIVIATVVSLFACGGGNETNETTVGNTEMTTEATDEKVEETSAAKVAEVTTEASDEKVGGTEAVADIEATTEAGVADMDVADATSPSTSG